MVPNLNLPSRSWRQGFGRGGAVSALVGSIAAITLHAEEASPPPSPGDRQAVRHAAMIIAEPYEPASRQERATEQEIRRETGSYLQGAGGSLREQASALAAYFGRGGGLHREAWWNGAIQSPILAKSGTSLRLGLDDLYRRTLEHSNQVKVLAGIPLIRETAIAEAEAEFDPEAYAESRYDRSNEPSGSSIERNEPGDLLRNRGWTFEGGLRKKTRTGAEISLGQQLSQESSNAQFFIPKEQGRARATLSVMQPLLKGAGKTYNRSPIQLAKLETDSGYSEFIGELENHLMEVNRLYWQLYLARGVLLEKRRLVEETEETVSEIESRSDLDSIASQRSRARSALASRKADLVRSELEIKNAESRLRTLVNDPAFVADKVAEIIPADLPISTMETPTFEKSVAEALSLRPEIRIAENAFRAADLRELVAANEKRPALDFVGEVGTSNLRAAGDWTGAFNDQYNGGEPTWGVGLIASMPLGRKAEKARHLRAQLEARQARDQLRATLDEVLLDVQIAHREVVTAWPDARAKWEAAMAADQELSVLRDRRDVETAESGASVYLENLLDAQQRRAFAREDFLTALATYNAALTNLERAKGTLLQQENVSARRVEDDQHLPLIKLVKDEAALQAKAVYESYE